MNSSRTFVGHHGSVYDVCWSGSGRRLASCGRDALVTLWSPDGVTERSLEMPDFAVAVRFSPDDRLVAAATPGGALRAWLADTGELAWQLALPSAEAVAFTADGDRLLVGGREGQVWILDAGSGREERSFSLSADQISSLGFSPDGDLLAVATSDAGIAFVETAGWTAVRRVELAGRGPCTVYTCVFAPNGQTCGATLHFQRGGSIGTTEDPDLYEIAVWPPLEEDPDLGQTLLGHVSWMKGLAFAPDGEVLVSGGFDESVRTWDPAFHTALGESREHAGAVYALAFAPDGTAFASCSADATVKIWDLQVALGGDAAPRPTRVPSEEMIVSLLAASASVGRNPLLVAAQAIADDLLALESLKKIDESIAAFVDTVYSLKLPSLGIAVSQTLTVRGEHARRTQDEPTAFRCGRLTSLVNQEIGLYTRRVLAGMGEPGTASADIDDMTPSPAFTDLATLLDGVLEGRVETAFAQQQASNLSPTIADLKLAAGRLESSWPDVLAGRRDGGPVRAASAIVANLADATGDDLLLALANDLFGRLLCLGGDNEAGLRRLEHAVAAGRRIGDPEAIQALVGNLANAFRNVGRLREARRAYDEALALAEAGAHYEGQVNHLTNLAIVEADLGNRAEEARLLLDAQAIARARDLDEQAAYIAGNLGNLYSDLGDYAGAIELCRDALEAAERSGNDRLRSSALGNLAEATAAVEDSGAAALYEEALGEARRLGDAGGEAHVLHGLSVLADRAGDAGRATALAADAVAAAERSRQPTRILSALGHLAGLRGRTGPEEAIELLERAVSAGEELRAEIQRSSEGQRIQARLASLYDDLVVLLADADRIEAAFEASERGRAALLVRRLHGDASAYRPRPAPELLRHLQAIGPKAVLVSFYVAGEEVLIFIVRSGEGVALERRPVPPGFLEGVRSDFEREVRSAGGEPIGETWLRLGQLVIEPVKPYLGEEAVLLLAPHRSLHNLPLHALLTDGVRVLERWPVAYVPSASALPYLLTDASGSPTAPVVVGAHFVDEALAVAGALGAGPELIGREVDANEALDALAEADLVHVSAHGFFSKREPDFSGWILRPSAELDEYLDLRGRHGWQRNASQSDRVVQLADWAEESVLSATDLAARRLSARLVVASACESGVIATDPADDPTGLVPALLEAGARGVVATLWLVDADTTKNAMVALYAALARQPDGWNRRMRALQEASLSVKRMNDHPFFWAPYVLIGGISQGEAA